jgi:hypothetical protein
LAPGWAVVRKLLYQATQFVLKYQIAVQAGAAVRYPQMAQDLVATAQIRWHRTMCVQFSQSLRPVAIAGWLRRICLNGCSQRCSVNRRFRRKRPSASLLVWLARLRRTAPGGSGPGWRLSVAYAVPVSACCGAPLPVSVGERNGLPRDSESFPPPTCTVRP